MLEQTKIKLDFAIFGSLLDPKLFSELIKINATEYWYKGDTINNIADLKRKETAWHYTIGFIETLYIEECTNKFIKIFSNRSKAIKQYLNINKLNCKIYFIIEVWNEKSPSIFFDRNFLNLVNKLNAEIDIDLYYITSIPEQE